APPEDITVSQWAEEFRVLPRQSAIPGPWLNRLTPYTVGVMDAYNDPLVEQISIMASVQSSKTEAAYNMLGYSICQDPAPALVVMPTQKTLKKVNKRLQSMFWASDELSSHLTGNPDDLKFENITLDRMEIHFATAGSESDLQFVEARILLLDEVDLYPPGAVKMASDRSTTFWNRKIIKLSRPTTEDGHIYQEYQRSDKRRFWVPCPFCGGYQVLSFWQVKHKGEKCGEWPTDKRDPEYIKRERVARYECIHCAAEIDDADKNGMLLRGKWLAEGQEIRAAAPPAVTHAGFWWNVLYSPFKSFSEVAAEFFDTKDDREKYRIFVTQWLAEPWKEMVQVMERADILKLRTSRPPLEVPEGTLGLTAGVDNQKRGCWYSLWAWVRLESGLLEQHLIRYGYCGDFTELEIILFQDVYYTKTGVVYPVRRGGIDTGGGEGEAGAPGMTEQVYQWLRLRGQGRVFGVKGSSRALAGGRKMQLSVIDKMPGRGAPIPGGLQLWILDTNALKDAFKGRMDSGLVHLFDDSDEAYEMFASHLAAENKERDNQGRWVWRQQGNRANHLLDTAIYALAMADRECYGGAMVWRPPEPEKQEERAVEHINPLTHKLRGSYWRR
ncbi:MAG: phage terminase large subunit family protein, partial [Candidatus Thermoplasmatota archaeon]|nr:phage terminase large subunit family protein [Candidatus Thermoplasmatota archaeon]